MNLGAVRQVGDSREIGFVSLKIRKCSGLISINPGNETALACGAAHAGVASLSDSFLVSYHCAMPVLLGSGIIRREPKAGFARKMNYGFRVMSLWEHIKFR